MQGQHDVHPLGERPEVEFELLPVAEAGDQPGVALSPDPALGRNINLLEPAHYLVIQRDGQVDPPGCA